MIFDSAHEYSLPPKYDAPFKPFSKKLDYMKLTASTDPTMHKNRGQNAVHYIDSLIGEILKSPDLKDPNRPTIIMVTSDHGESFNDLKKNYWGHSSNFTRFQLRVPLMIKWDGIKSKHVTTKDIDLNNNTSYSHMTTHNDMSHTYLETVFNCDIKRNQSVGGSLYSTESRLPLLLSTYSRHGVRTEDKIYSYEVSLGYEVYDLDYNEVTNHKVPQQIFKQYLDASTRFYK
jgi:membrane-anchored protein YejM (alkaline phosphatase superfamily)